jgi:hypothetical protein
MFRFHTLLKHFPRGLLLAAICLAVLPTTAHAGGKASATYDGAVGFGSQELRLSDSCLSIEGAMRSGNFFDDLKRTAAGDQFAFHKNGQSLTQYPESVTTSIRIMNDRCGANASSNLPSSVFDGNSYSLTFEVQWKDGMQLTPAAMSPTDVHCVGSRVLTDVRNTLTTPAVTCQLTIQSKGVPLLNHLIVSVYSPDGKRLTRLSAAP